MKKNFIILTVIFGISVIANPLPAHADEINSSSTVNNQSNSTDSQSNSEQQGNSSSSTQKIEHQYAKMTNVKSIKYEANLKNGLHHVYINGPKGTISDNSNPSELTTKKRVKITEQALVNGVKWSKINGKWIKSNYIDSKTHFLKVPMIGQRPQLPTGCEITAVTMMLKYAGANVNKLELAKEMPRSSNPNKGFVGNPHSAKGQLIYPSGLMKLVKHYAGNAVNMTGAKIDVIKKKISDGHPVVVWVANVDNFPNHALTVYGYDHNYIYYNDPWLNKPMKMKYAIFETHRRSDAMRALSY